MFFESRRLFRKKGLLTSPSTSTFDTSLFNSQNSFINLKRFNEIQNPLEIAGFLLLLIQRRIIKFIRIP